MADSGLLLGFSLRPAPGPVCGTVSTWGSIALSTLTETLPGASRPTASTNGQEADGQPAAMAQACPKAPRPGGAQRVGSGSARRAG